MTRAVVPSSARSAIIRWSSSGEPTIRKSKSSSPVQSGFAVSSIPSTSVIQAMKPSEPAQRNWAASWKS